MRQIPTNCRRWHWRSITPTAPKSPSPPSVRRAANRKRSLLSSHQIHDNALIALGIFIEAVARDRPIALVIGGQRAANIAMVSLQEVFEQQNAGGDVVERDVDVEVAMGQIG